MKVMKKIKNILLITLCIIFFAFAICMTVLLLNYNKYGVTQFDNTSLVIINDAIASNNYKKGDLVLVNSKKVEKLNAGEELFVYKLDSTGKASIEIGEIGEVHVDDKAISFKNGDTYSMEFVIGESSKIYKNIGFYLSIITSKWGFLFMILVPSFIIFIYEIYALVVEIKYGDQEVQQA